MKGPAPMNGGGSVLYTPLAELAAKVRARKVTSLSLVEESLERLATHGPKLNAVVTLAGEAARTAAREADREIRQGKYRGPLHGIPYGAKDLLATKEHADDVGRGAVSRAEVLLRRDSDPQAPDRGRDPDGEARDGGARRRDGLQQRGRLLHRSGAQPLEHGLLERRLVERPRLRGGSRASSRSRSGRRPWARS